jgi:hypothetical protein
MLMFSSDKIVDTNDSISKENLKFFNNIMHIDFF